MALVPEPASSMSPASERPSPSTPVDPAGAETLGIMQAAPRYNAWQYDRVAPYLGRRICEIGSGLGNMSDYLLRGDPELAVLTDLDPFYRDQLSRRFADRVNVVVDSLRLPDDEAARRFRAYRLDTVVALNVVEHITDDLGAMRSVRDLLGPGGRFVVLVPALPVLYGSLDRELGHARRYTRRGLADRLEAAGFSVERIFFFNAVGTLGWWFNARITRSKRIPARQLGWFDRLVPLLRAEDRFALPFGQSLIAVASRFEA